jgi:DNA-binding transcriptional LysR family regulator
METARCKAFLYSAETGSFSRAAEKLNYTPSGVSQLVSAMEEDMGFPLLHRSRKGVRLTEAGKTLLPAVRNFLQQEARIYQLAGEIRGLSIGEITIGTYPSISAHWLPQVIRSFQERYPQIKINLREGIQQEIREWLDDARADLAFFSYIEPMPYDWFPLAEDEMVAVLPRVHPLAGADRYPLKYLEKDGFIMPALGRDVDVVHLLEKNRLEPNIVFSTVENYAVLSMIENGLGMSVMNRLVTRKWDCDVAMLPLDPPEKLTLGIAVPDWDQAPPAVRRFVELAVKMLSQAEE